MNDPILDTRDAATAAGLTPRRIQQLVKEGRIPNRGTPRRIRVHLDDVLTATDDPLGLALVSPNI